MVTSRHCRCFLCCSNAFARVISTLNYKKVEEIKEGCNFSPHSSSVIKLKTAATALQTNTLAQEIRLLYRLN